MAFRSFIGSCATLTTSVTNLTILMVFEGEPAWICFTICNADILFCVIVLHWCTSKEQREGDSGYRSTGMSKGGVVRSTRGNNNPFTIGSQASRAHRVSTVVEGEEKGGCVKFKVASPDDKIISGTTGPATITTECVADRGRQSNWDASEVRVGVREDEVELNNIHVHTIQTQEVEVNSEIERNISGGQSTDGESEDWVASRRVVVSERLV